MVAYCFCYHHHDSALCGYDCGSLQGSLSCCSQGTDVEAGLSIGLTPLQTFLRIVLPQAFRIALPNLTTALLNLMRDAALAYTIGAVDVMGAGQNLISRNLGNYSLETYTAVALIYWGIALVVSLASQLLEKSLTVKER